MHENFDKLKGHFFDYIFQQILYFLQIFNLFAIINEFLSTFLSTLPARTKFKIKPFFFCVT